MCAASAVFILCDSDKYVIVYEILTQQALAETERLYCCWQVVSSMQAHNDTFSHCDFCGTLPCLMEQHAEGEPAKISDPVVFETDFLFFFFSKTKLELGKSCQLRQAGIRNALNESLMKLYLIKVLISIMSHMNQLS